MALIIEECRLEWLLEKNNMSKAEFARLMKVSRSTVTDWCKGKPMKLEHAFNVAYLLECSVHDLYILKMIRG